MTENPAQYLNGPKESDGKTPWEYFPWPEAEIVCRVFRYGAKKYKAPFTYRQGIPVEKLAAAVIRHATAILNGERIDPESGELHAAHISAGGMMIVSQSIAEIPTAEESQIEAHLRHINALYEAGMYDDKEDTYFEIRDILQSIIDQKKAS